MYSSGAPCYIEYSDTIIGEWERANLKSLRVHPGPEITVVHVLIVVVLKTLTVCN